MDSLWYLELLLASVLAQQFTLMYEDKKNTLEVKTKLFSFQQERTGVFKRFSEAKSGILFCTVRVCLFRSVFAEFRSM